MKRFQCWMVGKGWSSLSRVGVIASSPFFVPQISPVPVFVSPVFVPVVSLFCPVMVVSLWSLPIPVVPLSLLPASVLIYPLPLLGLPHSLLFFHVFPLLFFLLLLQSCLFLL